MTEKCACGGKLLHYRKLESLGWVNQSVCESCGSIAETFIEDSNPKVRAEEFIERCREIALSYALPLRDEKWAR